MCVGRWYILDWTLKTNETFNNLPESLYWVVIILDFSYFEMLLLLLLLLLLVSFTYPLTQLSDVENDKFDVQHANLYIASIKSMMNSWIFTPLWPHAEEDNERNNEIKLALLNVNHYFTWQMIII